MPVGWATGQGSGWYGQQLAVESWPHLQPHCPPSASPCHPLPPCTLQVRDETGRSMHPYAQWTRQWIAEENRHGDVLGRFLYLSGRVDMKQGTTAQGAGAGVHGASYLCAHSMRRHSCPCKRQGAASLPCP